MAKKTEVVSLQGETYTITQLGAVEGLALYHELIKALGPVLRDELLDVDFSDGKKLEGKIGGLVLRGLEALPGPLLERLRLAFARTTKIAVAGIELALGEGDLFDQHFAGRYNLLVQWLGHCIRINFLGFLGGSKPGQSPAAPTQTA